jgi:hypothetical protein
MKQNTYDNDMFAATIIDLKAERKNKIKNVLLFTVDFNNMQKTASIDITSVVMPRKYI